MKRLNFPKKYLLISTVASVLLLAVSAMNLQMAQNSLYQTSNLNSGLTTCINRLSQTYTAWSLKNINSPYLVETFWKDSNNCLSDVNVALSGLSYNAENIKETLNRILIDAHWFHEKLATAIDRKDLKFSNDNDLRLTVQDRYTSIESRVENIWDHFDEAASMSKEGKNTWTTTTLVASAILLLLIAYYISTEYQVENLRAKLNAKAKNILINEDLDQMAKIDQVITESLVASNFTQVARLYNDFAEEQLIATAVNRVSTSKAVVEEIQNTPPVELLQTTLGGLVDSVYESLSTRIFSSGVIVDLQCDDQVAVAGKGEDVQQLVHSILSLGLDKAENTDDKKVTLKIKALGDILRVRCTINTHCFNSDELEYFSTGNSVITNVNLAIMKEVIGSLNGEIRLNNEFANNDAKASIEINLEDVLVQTSAEQLVNNANVTQIVKGKKKDLLEKFKQATAQA